MLMKGHTRLAPTFTAEGPKQIQLVDAGKVCQDLSVRYPKERELE